MILLDKWQIPFFDCIPWVPEMSGRTNQMWFADILTAPWDQVLVGDAGNIWHAFGQVILDLTL